MSSYGGRGPTVNAALWTETALAAVFVVLRVYTRKVILRSFGVDDVLLICTLLLLAAYAACISAATSYGLGQLRADIPPEHYTQAMKYEIIGQAVCIFNIAVSKAAVGFFLLRIVRETWHKVFVWFCLVTTALISTFATIAVFIQCLPVEAVWDFNVKGNCWLDFPKIGMTTSAYAVVMDFTLALAPTFIIWQLNMKKKDKILTIIGLSLGVFAGLCGILRTVALTSLTSFSEYIYATVDMLIYSGTENFVSVMCASIPVLRPLWNKVVRGYGSSAENSSYGKRSYQLSRLGSRDPESALGNSQNGGMETKIYSSSRGGNPLQDNTSEETILRDTKEPSHESGEVFRHTEISVKYSNRKL